MKERIKKYYTFISLFFILVIVALSFLLYYARQDTLVLIKEQYNEQQGLLARQTAMGIEQNFAIVVRELEMLANMCAVKSIDLHQVREVIAETFNHVKKHHVADIGFIDADGIVKITVNRPDLVARDLSGRNFFVVASSLEHTRPLFEFVEPSEGQSDEHNIDIAWPIFTDDDEFGGVILFNSKLQDIIEGHSSAVNGKIQTWVIGKNGKILYHPNFLNQIGQNAEASTNESFRNFINTVQTVGEYNSEYVSPEGENILAASYPARIADQIWSIVISAPARNISFLLMQYNSTYTYLTICAMLAIIGGSLFMIFWVNKWNQVLQQENCERLRAEKELQKAHAELENRIEERTAELHDINEYLENEIEERKCVEAEIVKQNELVKNTLESLSHPFYVIDADNYVIQMANSAADFGALSDNSTCYQLTHQSDQPCNSKDHPCTIKEIKEKLKPVILHHTHYKDGQARIFEVHGYPIFDKQGNVIQVIEYTIDITESRKLEEQLHQSQKMESIGRLAGGVAHDFNNLLTAIIGFSELAQTKLSDDHPVIRDLGIVRDAGEKAAALVRKLLAFSRKQILEMKVVNLNALIHDILKLLGRIIGEDVYFEVNTGDAVENIKADPSQIEQILMNLVVNARDAMPDGGRISIETSDMVLDEDYTKSHKGIKPGTYVMLAITDTGKGMSQEVREMIFEPFFTTKGAGGTGLGLATVYGIVRQHKGHIFVYSEEGLGTTFKIYFPATERSVQRTKIDFKAAAPKGTETLLIVDDDNSVRNLIVETLQPLGYQIIDAASAEEVIEFLGRSDKAFELLLTDMVMPGMNGRELAFHVKEKYPDIKVIFMSGYTSDMVTSQGVLQAGEVFIQKPLSPLNLAKRIRDFLDRS